VRSMLRANLHHFEALIFDITINNECPIKEVRVNKLYAAYRILNSCTVEP